MHSRHMRPAAFLFTACVAIASMIAANQAQQMHAQQANAKQPTDYANGLVGTAPLDNQKLIGNAPPPGEQLYSGLIMPGAVLPHGSTELAPINNNTDLEYPAGVKAPYYYPNRTMYGFASGADGGPIVMPVVGDFTIPPDRSGSVYGKASEKAAPGYYSVYLTDYQTHVEMTATTWTGIYRFTFPASRKAHVLIDVGRTGRNVEVVGNNIVRGATLRQRPGPIRNQSIPTYFVAEFSAPFAAYGTFRQVPTQTGNASARTPLLGDKDVEPDVRTISGHYAGAYVQFTTTRASTVLMKIAYGKAMRWPSAAEAEQPGWDFDGIHAAPWRRGRRSSTRLSCRAERRRRRCCSTPACITPLPVRGWWRRRASSSRGSTARCAPRRTTATVRCPTGTRGATRLCC